ncbi:hypothetical protein [Serratia quinivorans]|uniref:hypothetical protein n=1 Tax=Serratia quinivorans TaxID=137545 RepID=UPI0021BD86F7|nr:hypothetical protein [Serratia quinivorans]
MDDNMRVPALFISILFLSSYAQASQTYPKDVNEYLKNADNCQYLSGEWDSKLPIKRQQEIEKEVNSACNNAEKQKEKLNTKYQKDKNILKVINAYDF